VGGKEYHEGCFGTRLSTAGDKLPVTLQLINPQLRHNTPIRNPSSQRSTRPFRTERVANHELKIPHLPRQSASPRKALHLESKDSIQNPLPSGEPEM
jgi:hypothetical protein